MLQIYIYIHSHVFAWQGGRVKYLPLSEEMFYRWEGYRNSNLRVFASGSFCVSVARCTYESMRIVSCIRQSASLVLSISSTRHVGTVSISPRRCSFDRSKSPQIRSDNPVSRKALHKKSRGTTGIPAPGPRG